MSLASCGGRSGLDVSLAAERDGGPVVPKRSDAGVDGGFEAELDGGFDAGADAAFDAILDAPVASDAVEASFADVIVPFDVSVSPDSGLKCADGGIPTAYLLDENGALYTFDPTSRDVRSLGTPECNTGAAAWTLSVSREGVAYILYQDWHIYAVDLSTLVCARTPFQPGAFGVNDYFGIAVSRTPGSERLLILGQADDQGDAILASSDLTSFVLSEIGPASPALPQGVIGYDTQADLLGHLFAYTPTGLLIELDAASANVIGSDPTGFPATGGASSFAVLSYDNMVYMFAGQTVARYDLPSHTADVLGNVGTIAPVVGASAVPCFGAP